MNMQYLDILVIWLITERTEHRIIKMVREMEKVTGKIVLKTHNDEPRNAANISGHQADPNVFLYWVWIPRNNLSPASRRNWRHWQREQTDVKGMESDYLRQQLGVSKRKKSQWWTMASGANWDSGQKKGRDLLVILKESGN